MQIENGMTNKVIDYFVPFSIINGRHWLSNLLFMLNLVTFWCQIWSPKYTDTEYLRIKKYWF